MISLTSCFPSRETRIISDFCQLHEPLNDELEPEVITYWKKESAIISTKNKSGGVKTPEEKFAEVMIDYAGTNDKKYYEKKCDQINSN
jgi:hypothetical protein